jgi:hypothetical protein
MDFPAVTYSLFNEPLLFLWLILEPVRLREFCGVSSGSTLPSPANGASGRPHFPQMPRREANLRSFTDKKRGFGANPHAVVLQARIYLFRGLRFPVPRPAHAKARRFWPAGFAVRVLETLSVCQIPVHPREISNRWRQTARRFSALVLPRMLSTLASYESFWPSLSEPMPARSTALI